MSLAKKTRSKASSKRPAKGAPRTAKQTPHHVAYHEAGHAIASQRFGHDLYSVTIVPTDVAAGAVHGDFEFHNDAECEGSAVALLAGYAAATRFDPAPDYESVARQGAAGDFAACARHLTFLGLDQAVLVERARLFVGKEWSAITLVAEDLVKRKVLDDVEVEILVEIADGNSTRQDLETYRERRELALR